MQEQQVITGKFLGAGKPETVGQNGFTVRKFWLDITDNPQYPNTPEFQLTGDKVNLVDHLTKGQTVIVKYNINGRKVTNRTTGKESVITNLTAWRIEVVQTQSAAVAGSLNGSYAQTAQQFATGGQPAAVPAGMAQVDDEPLPF